MLRGRRTLAQITRYALELVSGSTAALEDIEISAMDNRTYEFGHVAAAA
jgi:hypothetical protein